MAKLTINVERIVSAAIKYDDEAIQLVRQGKWKKAEQCLINKHGVLTDKEYFTKENYPMWNESL
jgi:hypothetical protein